MIDFRTLRLQIARQPSVLNDIQDIYRFMDRQYAQAAVTHGFHCSGCEESCCKTRFCHHTIAEWHYLMFGYDQLPLEVQKEVSQKAFAAFGDSEDYCPEKSKGQAPSNIMCPLNLEGSCLLYPFRPMICRLHGIPYEVEMPGRGKISGPGCHMFHKLTGAAVPVLFNRTPIYAKLAELEHTLRQTLSISERINLSVAQMICGAGR